MAIIWEEALKDTAGDQALTGEENSVADVGAEIGMRGKERWMGGSAEYCRNCEIKSDKFTPVLTVDMNNNNNNNNSYYL